MQKILLSEAIGLIYPRLTVLVTTCDSDGRSNAAPYSWIAPVSFSPPMLYLGIQRRETGTIKNLRATKEFVVNVVTKGWAAKAVACEAKTEDKVEKSGITLEQGIEINAPHAKEAKIFLECKLKDVIETGQADHFMVIGEIFHAEKSPELKNEDIVMHLLGENFASPGPSYKVERKR